MTHGKIDKTEIADLIEEFAKREQDSRAFNYISTLPVEIRRDWMIHYMDRRNYYEDRNETRFDQYKKNEVIK